MELGTRFWTKKNLHLKEGCRRFKQTYYEKTVCKIVLFRASKRAFLPMA